MKKKLRFIASVLVPVVMITMGCSTASGASTSGKATGKPITIGGIGDLTGAGSSPQPTQGFRLTRSTSTLTVVSAAIHSSSSPVTAHWIRTYLFPALGPSFPIMR